jgi:hypothetical protein
MVDELDEVIASFRVKVPPSTVILLPPVICGKKSVEFALFNSEVLLSTKFPATSELLAEDRVIVAMGATKPGKLGQRF